ncbi:ParB/RepB/Spo0J family partition protein [Antrihabitans spumae]|uniref:ParB-like N-terminal domain-containing protein n=1 Tax=Antrihabitans spumae TaxID=3373370 RepID=A0ABW7KST1_9NOCA
MNIQSGNDTSSESVVQQWIRDGAKAPAVSVPVASLLPADSPRINGCKVSHAKVLAACDELLPPIVVHRDTMRVVDGMHRLKAALLKNADTIEVQFFDGSVFEAFVLAVRVNMQHGLPLSTSDRKAAAARIIESHPYWSDRLIGATTGLSHKTVAVVRRRASGEDSQLNGRLGLDGKVHPLTNSDGRLIAAELLQGVGKDASLRKIASAAGISPGTVRDVRERIKRGDNPVPVRTSRSAASRRPTLAPGSKKAMSEDAGTQGLTSDYIATSSRVNHTAALSRLRGDPALRFNEKGRALIRLLTTSLTAAAECRTLVGDVPTHCLGTVVELAEANARLWHEFGRQILQLSEERDEGQIAQA